MGTVGCHFSFVTTFVISQLGPQGKMKPQEGRKGEGEGGGKERERESS